MISNLSLMEIDALSAIARSQEMLSWREDSFPPGTLCLGFSDENHAVERADRHSAASVRAPERRNRRELHAAGTTMKIMMFCRASQNRSPGEFQQWYLKNFASSLHERYPSLGRHLVNLVEAGPEELRLAHDSTDPQDRYDVVAEMTWAGEE